MRKLIVAEFMTLDGVMQAPGAPDEDTDGGFAHGGWTHPYWHDDMGVYFGQALSTSDTLLLGRKTWQGHGAAFEPAPADDPFASLLNSKKKYVVSNTLTDTSLWRHTTVIRGDVVEQVRALKAQPGENILTDGSSTLVHLLARHGLVDEYSLLVFPLVLGSGKKVFPDDARLPLRLTETRPFSTGVTLMRYAVDPPAGA